MKQGEMVRSLVDIQPLKKGELGEVISVDRWAAFPVVVKWHSMGVAVPMKYSEVSELKTTKGVTK